jgi:hypothetical protein
LENYQKFNESKNRNKGNKNRQKNQNWQNQQTLKKYPREENSRPAPRGMNMDFSDRFRYILTQMDKKGSKIAKDLLSQLNKPDAKFEYSFIDLTQRSDTLSYLPNAEKNTPEEEKYKSNKRQHSKVYKTIKTLFGSKYTKTEVNKFVSIYKQIYEAGPDREALKSKRTDGQLMKKIVEDTKTGKLTWLKLPEMGEVIRYEAKINITNHKYLSFVFFILPDKTKSLVTINFFTDLKKNEWVQTFNYKDLTDFLTAFKEKYNEDVI